MGDPSAPNGSQVAFLKDNAGISQTVYLDAGVYNLSFFAAQRLNYNTQNQGIEVLIDGTPIETIVPNSPVVVNDTTQTVSYAPYQTYNFQVGAGTHTVELLGTSPSTADSTAFLDEVAITPVQDTLDDGGFETPALAVNSYTPDVTGAAWEFFAAAGISRNGSNLATNWIEAQNAPAGVQTAYLQNNGSMLQNVFLDAGTYQLAFLAAQRAINQSHYEEIEIAVDGVPEGVVNPVNNLFGYYQSSTFTVSTGLHTIAFLGLNPLGGTDTAFLDQVVLSANAMNDGSFETPALITDAFQFAANTGPWNFSSTTGLARNGDSFTSGNPNAPDGSQVAFIQGSGVISQSVYLIAGSYNISFYAAQRANDKIRNQEIEVFVDGGLVGTVTPGGTAYSPFETSSFTVGAGTHLVKLVGVNPQGANATDLIDAVSLTMADDEISDSGFEAPILASNSYITAPTGTSWQFTGSAGIAANNSSITTVTGIAPQGTQVGFITNNGTISQTIYLDADTYDLSFLAAQRANQTQQQQIQVWVDSTLVGVITPTPTSTTLLYAYTQYESPSFTVAAGVHTITFVGTNPTSGQSTAFIDGVKLLDDTNTLSDGSFESPVLPSDSYTLDTTGSAWNFTGLAGISTNLSAFTNGSAYAPVGNQDAFLKNNASISQSVYFDAGTYNITFLATQRVGYQPQEFQVTVGSMLVGTFTPTLSSVTSNGLVSYTFAPYQTANFTLTAGSYTVTFQGLTSGDCTAFIDDVVIYAGCAISDGTFNQTTLPAQSYQTNPSGSPWTFSALSGVATNGSAFTSGNPDGPGTGQVAYIKDDGTMSQSVYLAAGFYNISFLAAQRENFQTQYQSIDI